MDIEKIKELIAKTKVALTDPAFYPRLFSLILKVKKKAALNSFKAMCEEEYGDLSRLADLAKVQESVSIRNVLRTRSLASFLVNEKGEMALEALTQQIEIFKKFAFSIGPFRQHDSVRQDLILKVLTKLSLDKEILALLKTVSKPYANPAAEEIIRNTLQLPDSQTITDAHAKRAAISALLCYLRQSVGSCFGTAPAIIIHDEQPKQFLKDIIELFGTGRLKRTFGGLEYSVPLSSSFGIGDLGKQFVFSDDSHLPQIEIWYSPGLIAALEAVSIFPEDFKIKNKIEKTKELVLSAIKTLKKENDYLITSIEQLIRAILLNQFNLREEDISNYLSKEKMMNRGGLLVSVSQGISNKTDISKSAAKFLSKLEAAKTAFKILADNALLKSWEFTIASFSENKAGFTTWNLYSSLGFKPNEIGGIGHCIFEVLKIKLDDSNRRVHEFQEEYEATYAQLKYLEARARNASTEKEIQWMKAEYQSKGHEFYLLEEMRDKIHAKAKRLANLFDLLIDIYMTLFPQYFQEVYDASMRDVAASRYDDSPAGFRLLFKYGRGNTAQWTQIYTPEEFIEALAAFFTSTESEIRHSAEMEDLEEEFSEITTAILLKVRSPEFLETAFSRMAEAHHTRAIKDPLKHLDKIEKKPWAYVSGGSMATLISTYYKREQKPNEVERWVENPTELLIFFIDSMKQLPQKIKEEYVKDANKSMLIHSPTHAFLLKPGFAGFKKAWQSEMFTYTYVRDKLILPAERFIRQIVLDHEMMEYLIEEIIGTFPANLENYIKRNLKPIYQTLSPLEFRNHLIDQLQRDKSLFYNGQPLYNEEVVDAKLYETLPLFYTNQLRQLVENVFNELAIFKTLDKNIFNEILDALSDTLKDQRIISANRLQDICKAIICLATDSTSFEVDYHELVAKACRNCGYAMPEPILVADSNWVKDFFGFVVNPGTGRFEFWRLDKTGVIGHPMTVWEEWLNGSRRDLTWGIYNVPYEYTPL